MSYTYVALMKSPIGGKKFRAVFIREGKEISHTDFGAEGYEDYTTHKDEKRKEEYLARHKARENWNDYRTAGALSRWLLWNRRTLKASFSDYLKRFRLKEWKG